MSYDPYATDDQNPAEPSDERPEYTYGPGPVTEPSFAPSPYAEPYAAPQPYATQPYGQQPQTYGPPAQPYADPAQPNIGSVRIVDLL